MVSRSSNTDVKLADFGTARVMGAQLGREIFGTRSRWHLRWRCMMEYGQTF